MLVYFLDYRFVGQPCMLLLKRMQDNEIIHSTLFLSIGKPHSNNKFTVMYLLLNKKLTKK